MDRKLAVHRIRKRLSRGGATIGSWIHIPHGSISEIMGAAGYDWVAVDMEHGSISVQQLPDLCRALELGGTLPLVRIAEAASSVCKQALDAGAGGVIVPAIRNGEQLKMIGQACRWPPAGSRGVGFSRANLFGKNFEVYRDEAQSPFLVAMIEDAEGVSNLDEILSVEGLDAILIGPYDLSASLGVTAKFHHPLFLETMQAISETCSRSGIPFGVHIVDPNPAVLSEGIAKGMRFIAYGIDAVFLYTFAQRPELD